MNVVAAYRFVRFALAAFGVSLAALAAMAQPVGSSDVIARGEYLTRAADCEACHTVPGGQPFIGGRAFSLPFGVIYSPNITSDNETGLGTWSDDEFVRALHQGIGKDGEHLYPAFPYASYTGMSREDALAIKAYLLTIPPSHAPTKENSLAFPFNQRWGMAFWNLVNLSNKRFIPDPAQSADWNRGNYLANALGHCGECHTPRTVTFGLDASRTFAGGEIEGWRAYNLSADKTKGLGAWSDDQIESYLSTGHAEGRGAASGPMEEVVRLSLSHLDKADVHALGTYLRSIPPQASSGDPVVNDDPPALRQVSYVPSEPSHGLGQKIFEGSCSSCHGWDGGGIQTSFAALKGSGAVNDVAAMNLVQVVLSGSTVQTEAGEIRMPAFGNALTDVEIAEVANYVIGRFGGKDAAITAAAVSRMRDPAGASSVLAYLQWVIPAMVVSFLLLCALVFVNVRRRMASA